MRFTLSWLGEHLEFAAGSRQPEFIARRLTELGLDVEHLERPAAGLENFVVGRIVAVEKHPRADRLHVCRVDTGREIAQVVCGAPNVAAGRAGVFAAPGCDIPGTGLHLKPAEIRGVESRGMLLSERELGVSDDHDGIVLFDEPAPAAGTPYLKASGRDDVIFDVAVTPNRGDWYSVRGIARELAAGGCGRLRPLPDYIPPVGHESPLRWRRAMAENDAALVPAVRGRHLRIDANGASPAWLRRRLEAAGQKSISTLVDLTNYFTFDLGRPLHVFDAAKVSGDLVLRRARAGEKLVALDEEEYALTPDDIVIASGADGEKVEAIAGIMGGLESGVDESSREIMLEVALFDSVSVAKTGRRLGLESEARRRFERGLDPKSLIYGERLASGMILRLCGGAASEPVGFGRIPARRGVVSLPLDYTRKLGGLSVSAARQTKHLKALGFEVEKVAASKRHPRGVLRCRAPSWRGDVETTACLVEDILRLEGYARIPARQLDAAAAVLSPAVSAGRSRESRLRHLAAWRGLDEHLGYSFVGADEAALFAVAGDSDGDGDGDGDGAGRTATVTAPRLRNPISAELSVMRPSVLASLVRAGARNLSRGHRRVALFELGPRYLGARPEEQESCLGIFRGGIFAPRFWRGDERDADIYDVKADVLAALAACDLRTDSLRSGNVEGDGPEWMHPTRGGAIFLGEKVLAHYGEAHPLRWKEMGLRGAVVMAEVYLGVLPGARYRVAGRRSAPVVSLQPAWRDFAFVVDAGVDAERVLRAIRGAGVREIGGVRLFDVYSGEELGTGRVGYAVEVMFRPAGRSFTDAELEDLSAGIVSRVREETGGELRS
ncbi:MAG: phenylalanine--tRNA ligase subunit beta [Alphaproteobacteria bacterium]|nr:phenylalanine--tRNA ligase subunit beta [Alphaproteobacteria bacterium]MDA8003987.1 phenylalanine--tRNA ligase subunit beta [Alphaproteobacteria bacterium]MDA8005190.1 phenylalanine--tRNA ligase subunit beta [Alphaproteobacteria bacterium]MDA8012653.1 phenylalanine--tRNA ligase subunit beta [Alphaproteobacteria bacterium]